MRRFFLTGHLPKTALILAGLVLAGIALLVIVTPVKECCHYTVEDQPLAGITDIAGAFYDDTTQQVIVAGERNKDLPPISYADIAVLWRGFDSGRGMGVSIEPKPFALANRAASGDYEAMEEFDSLDEDEFITSLGEEQAVRYVGPVANTHVGQVFYEADRYLKSLWMGRDTVNGGPIGRGLAKHKDQFDLIKEYDTLPPLLAYLTIRPETVRVTFLKVLPGVSFEYDVRMQLVLTDHSASIRSGIQDFLDTLEAEQVPLAQAFLASLDGSELLAEDFVAQINEHYDSYADRRPELRQLEQYAKLLTIMAWHTSERIRGDLSWMETYPEETIETPDTTPVIEKSVRISQLGRQKVPIVGGVDMTVPIQLVAPYQDPHFFVPGLPNTNNEPRDPSSRLGRTVNTAHCDHIYPCEAYAFVLAEFGPGTSPDPLIIAAARRGAEEENGCVNKLGRAAEMAALAKLESEGMLASDLNTALRKNIPAVDISTESVLIQVKATLAKSQEHRLASLARQFDEYFGQVADNKQEARRQAATALLNAQDDILLPDDFLSSDHHAGYVQDRTEFWIPDNLVEPLAQTLIQRGYDETLVLSRVKGLGLNTWDLADLLPERCVSGRGSSVVR